MSRRRGAEKRTILPDPKYGDQVLAKFINILMRSGKKSTAEKIVYGALQEISDRSKGGDSLDLFKKNTKKKEKKNKGNGLKMTRKIEKSTQRKKQKK
jgi:ribosomal protein S7